MSKLDKLLDTLNLIMTADLSTNRMRILKFDSPARIVVRFVAWEKNFYRLKDAMNEHFRRFAMPDNPSLALGSVVCLLLDSQWYRALVIAKEGNLGGKLQVKLVDTGEIRAVLSENVRRCPLKFKEDRAFCFRCHLQGVPDIGLTEENKADIEQMLPENKIVNLRTVFVNGSPVQKSWSEKDDVELTEYSLPCDLTWCSDSEEDPFSPSGRTFNSLIETCLKFVGVEINNFDVDISEENLAEDVGEFCDIIKQEASPTFQWLPPQLPESNEFSARGVFVDHSGQIYVQLNSLRHTAHGLKKLLMEKFRNSQPDEDHEENPLVEGQSCCVKWGDPKLDGGWFRGKFLHYTDSKRTRAKIYLVDYGNPFEADVRKEVRRDIYAARVPILALRLELAEVTPLGPDGTYCDECLDIIQEKIAYKVRGAKKNRKLKVQAVGNSHKLPLRVNIQFEEDKVKLDLADFLTHFKYVERKSNKKPSALFRERRLNWIKPAVDAVAFGSYKEKNFYALIRETREEEDLCYKPDHVKHLDWSLTTLAPGDVLRVEIVGYGDYRTVYLHCADPDQEYLCRMLDEYDQMFEDIQAECKDMPPVFQPSVGMLVCGYTEDGWHRAVVTGYTERDITLTFIDWGNTVTIRDSLKVKEIPENFTNIPCLAIKLELEVRTYYLYLEIKCAFPDRELCGGE